MAVRFAGPAALALCLLAGAPALTAKPPRDNPAKPPVTRPPAGAQAPLDSTGTAAQTQAATGLIVTLEALRTGTARGDAVTGGREGSATVVLSGPARAEQQETPRGGTRARAPMVMLTSSDPVLVVPTAVSVPVGERQSRFTFMTNAVTQPKEVTITATFGGVSKTGKVTVIPSQLLRIEMPDQVRGGQAAEGRVVLNGPPADTASGRVRLTSENSQLLKVPATVVVPVNQTQVTFDIETFGVPEDQAVRVAGVLGEQDPRTASMTLLPPVIEDVRAGLGCPGPCTGSLHVTLDGIAPAGGLPIELGSELPVHIQAEATVPAGQTEVSVPFTAPEVPLSVTVTLSASYGGTKKRANFTVYTPEKHDLYVRRKTQIVDRFGNVVSTPPDSQPFQLCVDVAHKNKKRRDHPPPTALAVTYRVGSSGRTFQMPVTWEPGTVYVDNDDWDLYFKRICMEVPGIEDAGVMEVETIADARKELDERDEGNNDRRFKIER